MSTVPGTELDRTRRQFADLSGRLLQAIAGSAKYLPSDEAALLRRLNPKVLAGLPSCLRPGSTRAALGRCWASWAIESCRCGPSWTSSHRTYCRSCKSLGRIASSPRGCRSWACPFSSAILQSPALQIWALALADKFLPSSPGYSG
jgi:hypothetical protein